MKPQQLIRTILDAVAEDDLRKAEDAIAEYVCKYGDWLKAKGIHWNINKASTPSKKIYELFTQQNKP